MAVAVTYPYYSYQAEIDVMMNIFGEMGVDGHTISIPVLDMHVDNAYTAIRKYLRLSNDADTAVYRSAAIELAIAYYSNYRLKLNKMNGKQPVTQQTQGSRSVTFASAEIAVDNNGMIESVKAILPNPPIVVY